MIQALLDYQAVDAKLKEIEKTLTNSEERKKAVSAKKYLESVEENVNKLDARASELVATYEQVTNEQLKLKEQESAIADAINGAEDEKEVLYLLKKIEEIIAKIKSLGSKANKISEEIQAVMKEYATIKNNTKVAQTQLADNLKKYNELKDSVKDEKEQVEKQLGDLKNKVDPVLMDRYLQKRANKIYPVLYAVRDNVCGACGMELSMSVREKLKNGEVVDCENCQRMNYVNK